MSVSDNVLAPYYVTGACFSLVASLFVIISTHRFKELRQHPASLIYWRSWFDVFFSVQFIILFASPTSRDHCAPFSFVFQFAVLGSQSWYFMIALDLFFAMTNPFRPPHTNLRYYHGYVWGTSLASAAVLVATDSTAFRSGMQICWIKSTQDAAQVNLLNWVLFFIPTLVYYLSSVCIVFFATKRLRRGLHETFRVRTQVLKKGQRYVAAFAVYWTLAGVIYANVYFTEKSAENVDPEDHLPLYSSFAVVIAIRGLLDVAVWTYNEGVIDSYRRAWNKLPPRMPLPPVNNSLRREVLIYTTQGICSAVQTAAQHEEVPRRITREMLPANFPMSANDPAIRQLSLRRQGNRPVPFYDYAPAVFRFLRARFGVDEEQYLNSIRGDSDGINSMIEKYTEGASGSFFYFSTDGMYIVKTLTPGEAKALLHLLPVYATYMASEPESLLVRLIGFHGIELHNLHMYLVVMRTVFATNKPIHTRYDLKGSWVRRHADLKPGQRGVLKDGDLNYRITMMPTARRAFLDQIEADTEFLASQGIMDYSLLLGVHNVRQRVFVNRESFDEEEATESMPLRSAQYGPSASASDSSVPVVDSMSMVRFQQGVPAGIIEGPGRFFFGIIDILQGYTWEKRIERFLKVYCLCREGEGISAMPPLPYRRRFVQSMEDITEDAVVDAPSDLSSPIHHPHGRIQLDIGTE